MIFPIYVLNFSRLLDGGRRSAHGSRPTEKDSGVKGSVRMVWGRGSKVEGERRWAHGSRRTAKDRGSKVQCVWFGVEGRGWKADRAGRMAQVGCLRAWRMGRSACRMGIRRGIRTTPGASLRGPQDQMTGSNDIINKKE
jgi:hypothetical protein